MFFKHKKAIQALNLFARKEGGSINKMKAIKLIWLADRAHLRSFGRPIIMDKYFALPFGPVPSSTKDLAEQNCLSEDETMYRNNYILTIDKYNYKSIETVEEKVFSSTDLNVLNSVYSQFGHLTEFELSDLSHLYPEWKKHESGLKSGISSRYSMDYLDFFEDPDSYNDSMFNESLELKNLAKEIFTENFDLAHGHC